MREIELLVVIGGLGTLVLLFGAILAMSIFPLLPQSNGMVIAGEMKIKTHTYPYLLGDQLLRYGGAALFSGIELQLPKKLPHIFLDAHANDRKTRRPEFVYDPENRVSLEGDFDRYFQAYAPTAHKMLALSILTPEVLQTCIRSTHRFDVEIIEDKVRLIVPSKRVTRNERLQQELMVAAEAVMKEIDHRLRSWNEAGLVGDVALDVKRVNRS